MFPLGLPILLCASSVTAVGAADEREQRLEELKEVVTVLADALRDSEDAFPRGRVTFRSRFVETNRKAGQRNRFVILCEGTLLWDGDRARWETRHVTREEKAGVLGYGDPAPLAEEPAVPKRKETLVRIRTAEQQIISELDAYWANVRPVEAAPLPLEYCVRPRDCWTGLPKERGVLPWRRELENLVFILEGRIIEPPTVEVGADAIQVVAGVRRFDRNPTCMMRLDARLDGVPRVVACRFGSPTGGYLEEYRADWKTPRDGPAAVSFHTLYGNEVERQFDLLVDEYDPDPEIPADAFKFSSLRLPPGSQIIYDDASGQMVRREIVPGRVTPPDQFKKLAEELKAGAFAGGDEDGGEN